MDTRLIREVRCITRMCQGVGIPLGCNSCAFVGMGCVLYHAGRLQVYIAGSPGEIKRPISSWRKGPPCVGKVEIQEINGRIGSGYEVFVDDVSRPHDAKHSFVILWPSCTLLGL